MLKHDMRVGAMVRAMAEEMTQTERVTSLVAIVRQIRFDESAINELWKNLSEVAQGDLARRWIRDRDAQLEESLAKGGLS